MGQRHGHNTKRSARHTPPRNSPSAPAPPPVTQRQPPVVYGQPFILLEDSQKVAFIYQGGNWVQYARTIAECRIDSQVKELPQKINGMTRYEVSSPR